MHLQRARRRRPRSRRRSRRYRRPAPPLTSPTVVSPEPATRTLAEPAEPARVSPEPAWLIRMAPSTLADGPVAAAGVAELAGWPSGPPCPRPRRRRRHRRRAGVWMTICGMSRQAMSPTPRTRTLDVLAAAAAVADPVAEAAVDDGLAAEGADLERQAGIGLDDLDLDVGAVLRDHRDPGHGVLHLDRGGAGGAGGGKAGGRAAASIRAMRILEVSVFWFGCGRRAGAAQPTVTCPPPETDLVTWPLTAFTRMPPKPEIEASRLWASPPNSTRAHAGDRGVHGAGMALRRP